ncbi:MAG: DUF2065 domain-containing protein [Algiphilus sp.]
MWDDLFRALALVLVIEGLLPFAAPARWRETMLRLATLDDRQLRIIGVTSIIAGLSMLQLVRLL